MPSPGLYRLCILVGHETLGVHGQHLSEGCTPRLEGPELMTGGMRPFTGREVQVGGYGQSWTRVSSGQVITIYSGRGVICA